MCIRDRVSGTKVRRPRGQLKPPSAELPSFGPCKRLDFELEMGVVIGQGSPIGEPCPITTPISSSKSSRLQGPKLGSSALGGFNCPRGRRTFVPLTLSLIHISEPTRPY